MAENKCQFETVEQIIKAAGGSEVVGEAVGLTSGVRKWHRVGIHDSYWPTLMKMVKGLTERDLMLANHRARAKETVRNKRS